jgi:hypothetical protein
MTRAAYRILQVTLAIGTGFCVLFANDQASMTGSATLVTEAQARVGRPATPMSYAGVARRTTRRGVYGAAAVGVGVPAAATGRLAGRLQRVIGPSAYGRLYTACW